jgi:serine phosphatase RsbU (regulator of sigma subunit)
MEKIAAEAAEEAQKSALEQARAEAAAEALISSIRYASKIQKNILPDRSAFKAAFDDYHIVWEPRDIVGGDIYWLKNFEAGSLLCVCDCTGHGTPGALLTMLVVSMLESAVNADNCEDTAEVMWQLERSLAGAFHFDKKEKDAAGIEIRDGCDLAILFFARDGSVTYSSANINILICDGNAVRRVRGQKIFIGEGKLERKEEIETEIITVNKDNKFYIASDGVFSQSGGAFGRPYGYKDFERVILENHDKTQEEIANAYQTAFNLYRGDEPQVDDIMVISVKPGGLQ